MAKSKGIYVAVAPLALLLIAGVGAHFLPILLGDNQADPEDTPPAILRATTKHAPMPPAQSVQKPAKPVDAKTQAAIEKAVSGQIAAFHRNDFGSALAYSAPRFRAMLTPDDFRTMINRSYPTLVNAVTQSFQAARGTSSEVVIPVLVAANDGSVTRYMYILGSGDGGWFITGCTPMGPIGPMEAKPAPHPNPALSAASI